jgi:hypothetical protein
MLLDVMIVVFVFISLIVVSAYWYHEGYHRGYIKAESELLDKFEQGEAEMDEICKQLDKWHDELLSRKAVQQAKAKKNN